MPLHGVRSDSINIEDIRISQREFGFLLRDRSSRVSSEKQRVSRDMWFVKEIGEIDRIEEVIERLCRRSTRDQETQWTDFEGEANIWIELGRFGCKIDSILFVVKRISHRTILNWISQRERSWSECVEVKTPVVYVSRVETDTLPDECRACSKNRINQHKHKQ